MQSEDIVYGPHSVADALDAGRAKRLWIVDTVDRGKASQIREKLAQQAESTGIPVERVKRSYLDSRMGRANHQGIAAKVSPFPYTDFDDWLEKNPPPAQCLVIVLDGVQDPGNLGHILRQAAGFSAHGVIIPERRACGVTPTVEKTSAGYAGRVPVCRVNNLTRAIESLRKIDIWCYAADSSGRISLTETDFPARSAWVVGSEHEGVSRLVMKTCDETVRIPMPGEIESFNVATAAALGMYEYRRKWPDK
ncbi:MAG TPA: 23S rRNA (guanosine(2251)-2'-O)-methyltransferase RlmB [Firmicutes bacterium]|nr:23S rRNA (guanosine(2251)-2'-O)-methyltransferase RlmB [Bacillota bacterium]